MKKERQWRLPGLMYANELVLCGESREDLRVGLFADVFKRKGRILNADKTKLMLLGGEEGPIYEILVDRIRLEHVSELKYLGNVSDESGADGVECSRKVAS